MKAEHFPGHTAGGRQRLQTERAQATGDIIHKWTQMKILCRRVHLRTDKSARDADHICLVLPESLSDCILTQGIFFTLKQGFLLCVN